MRRFLLGAAIAAGLAPNLVLADSTVPALGAATTLSGASIYVANGGANDNKAALNTAAFCLSTGTITLCPGGVTNAMLANSSITLNTHAVSLGGSLSLGFSDLSGTASVAQLPALTASHFFAGDGTNRPIDASITGDLGCGTASAGFITCTVTGIRGTSIAGIGTGVAAALNATTNSATGIVAALTPTNNNCVLGNGTAWTSASCPGGNSFTGTAGDLLTYSSPTANGHITPGTGVATALAAATNGATGIVAGLTPTNNNCVLGNGSAWTSGACPGSTTTITLSPGLASSSAYNTGTQTATNGSTIAPQLFYEGHATSATVASTDGGKLLTATAAGVTFTAPNPGVAGASSFFFGYNASYPYTVTTVGGTATIYGCGASGTSVTLMSVAQIVPDGTNYQCIPSLGAGAQHYAATSATITATQWANFDSFVVTTASQTLTLPATTTLTTQGGIVIQTANGVPVSVAPNGTDQINGSNTTAVIPGGVTTVASTDGAGHVTIPLGPVVPLSITYAPGINPNNLPIVNISTARTIVGIRCTPEVAAGGTATISVVKAASGTALSAGTVLHSGSCNANGTAATDQDLTLTSTTLAAGDRLGITTTGTTVWTSSGVAAGVVTVFVR